MKNPNRSPVAASFLTHIWVAGISLFTLLLLLLSVPGNPPVEPRAIKLDPTNGCFYAQSTDTQPTSRIARPCLSSQELLAFKAGRPSAALLDQLIEDRISYVASYRQYLDDIAQYEKEKGSMFEAFARRMKPMMDAFDALSPSALWTRLTG